MKVEKIVLDEMERCYCNAYMKIANEDYFLFASEANPGVCYAYHGKDLSKKDVVWDNIGGTMSIVPFTDRQGEFLAITEMYLKESPSRATLVWAKKVNEIWQVQPILHLPYIHRFDIYHVENKNYFVAATIARDKINKEDWRHPGQIYVGEIPDDLQNETIKLRLLKDNLYVNHGYWSEQENGIPCGYFGSEEGITKVTPPHNGNDWKIEKVLKGHIGEISLIDINSDGEKEIITIEPFHGDSISIYQKINSNYEKVYKYPFELEFAHALSSGKIGNNNAFFIGSRKANQELAIIQYIDNKYVETIIDKDVGPANFTIKNIDNVAYVLSSNHTSKKACLYKIEGE